MRLSARAREVVSRYKGMKIEDIAAKEGLEIIEVANLGKLEDIYVYPVIFIPSRLSQAERCWRVAHCLGHHFLHGYDQLKLGSEKKRCSREMEADTMGACLITGQYYDGWNKTQLHHIRRGLWPAW